MNRNVLVLASAEREDTPYDLWAAGTGIQPYLLTSEEKYPGYQGRFQHVQAFSNYRVNGLVEKTALELARKLEFSVVLARGEVDILRAAKLRDVLGIPGQGWESALAFRDKLVMKRVLRRAGIPVAHSAALRNTLDLLDFIETHGYPVVIKPVLGSGSLDTWVVRDEKALEPIIARGVGFGMMVEAFVAGEMYHVDGLAIDSQVVFVRPSQYITDLLCFQRGEASGSFLLTEGHPLDERLVQLTRRVLRCMPVPATMTFHLEVFRTPDDRLIVCEIASRTGGARINQTIEYASGLNLDQQWFNAQCGLELNSEPTHGFGGHRTAGFCLIYPRDAILAKLPQGSPPEWVSHQRIFGTIGERYHGGYKSGDFLAAFVVGGDSEDQVQARLRDVIAWFERGTQWRAGSASPERMHRATSAL